MEDLRNISVVEPPHCTGCGACAQRCPTEAIVMAPDHEGFLAPVVDEQKCIHCKACQKVCHTLKQPAYKGGREDLAYAAYLRESKLRQNSSSGGVFAKAAQVILREGGVAYGAAWDEKMVVRHIGVTKEADLKKLQGSKYVQSDTSKVFRAVQDSLNEGKKTLFSGTPCQVAALYAFLGKDLENLITMDLICHGTPSPGLFERRCTEMGRITSYRFRTRRKIGAPKSEFIAEVRREGTSSRLIHYDHDAFFRMFLNGIIFRRACYTCPYANVSRIGDITIGDCDSADHYGMKYQSMSASTVILHSEKGRVLWKEMEGAFESTSLDLELEAKQNAQLSAPFPMPAQREEIFETLSTLSWEEIQKKYAKAEGRTAQLKNCLRQYIPYEFSLKLSRVRGRGK